MQPLDSEKSLIKTSHCKKDIFGFFVPGHCPICGQSLDYRKLEEAPVSIPSPFVNGHRERCSFLLKPTTGTFLSGYDGSSDLHVGITSTNGLVYNYNETGVHKSERGWEQCVMIPLVQPDMHSLLRQWDVLLEQFSAADIWLPHSKKPNCHAKGILLSYFGYWPILRIHCDINKKKDVESLTWLLRYNEHLHNCYTYAIMFINCALSAQKKQQMTKGEFTEKFVLPQTRKASKYITVYKEICKHGFCIVDHPCQEEDTSTEGHLTS